MKTLNLSTFPLDGMALMEASAGTGKTYALSNLYLRYILEKQYQLDQILVVTFTEAATQELRVRVRANIVECIYSLERVIAEMTKSRAGEPDLGEAGSSELSGADISDDVLLSCVHDGLLRDIFARLPNLYQSLIDLKLAEQSIDLSEIHTIHGFCQKVAKENAVLLNVPSAQTLKEDLKPLRLEVCQDLWRTEILKLNPACLAYIEAGWKTPDGLSAALGVFGARKAQIITPNFSLAKANKGHSPIQHWQYLFASFVEWVNVLKQLVLTHYDSVADALKNSDVKSLSSKLKWLESMRLWCESAVIEIPSTKLNFERFCERRLLDDVKVKGRPPEHPFFALLEQHMYAQPSGLDAQFLQALHLQVESTLEQRKAQDQLLSFDDLILQLKQGLDNPDLATSLVRRLRAQYQVALIDEFQDTDATQYPIFSRIFGVDAIEQSPSLVLIGDPKQAIYGFRGGDMATYLKAKADVAGHPTGEVYTMDKNWRSSPDMIGAMNALFVAHSNPFLEENIAYIEVSAAKDAPQEAWGPALRFSVLDNTYDEKNLNKDDTRTYLAMICADHVTTALESADLALQAKDLAILVRDKNEAEVMRDALSNVGVKACFDDKSNVFLSDEASSLFSLLKALAAPRDDYLLGLVLQNPLWCIDDASLSAFNQTEEARHTWLNRFVNLNEHWRRYGVLSVIRQAIALFEVLPKWKASTSAVHWERTLTNIGQLAELLQTQSRTHRTNTALIHWLEQTIHAASAAQAAEYQLRLESDESLVRIVTIHKSKGLEYPVVFLPFLYTSRESNHAWYYDDEARLCLAMEPSEKEAELADKERLAEEMRLLYVALTRAKYRCYIGTSQFESSRSLKMSATALGFLLKQNRSVDAYSDDWLIECLDMAAADPAIIYEQCSADDARKRFALLQTQQSSSGVSEVTLAESREAPHINTKWKVHSFTGLMNEHTAIVGDHWHVQDFAEPSIPLHEIHILNFPKGSQAGTFLHALFEDIEFATGELSERLRLQGKTLPMHIALLLEQYALVSERLVADWATYLSAWVQQVLAQHLLPEFCLQQLALADYKVEAQFYFSVDGVDVNALNGLIQRYDPTAPRLVFEHFEGHIKGAIDLMFRHDGKYYVLDYKSNHLGFSAHDYRHEALSSAIMEHRYDVQYLLYSLAVHRLLKARMGDSYCYDRHFGGVLYLFLRGLNLDASTESAVHQSAELPGVFYKRPERELITALDQLFSNANEGDFTVEASAEDGSATTTAIDATNEGTR